MKNIIVLFSLILFISCTAQNTKKETKKQDELAQNDIKPKVDFKVNKEYDENGNLIRYDSIYSYYYSNVDKNDKVREDLMKKFNEHFSHENPMLGDDFMSDFFRNDPIINEDFFSDDFFQQSFEKNQDIMKEMLLRMDAVKNQYFRDNLPDKEDKDTSEPKE